MLNELTLAVLLLRNFMFHVFSTSSPQRVCSSFIRETSFGFQAFPFFCPLSFLTCRIALISTRCFSLSSRFLPILNKIPGAAEAFFQ